MALLVHLDRGGAGALSLVCDLNLTPADLNSRRRILLLTRSAFLLGGDRRQPFAAGAFATRHAFCFAHGTADIGEHTLRATNTTIHTAFRI